MRTIRYIRERYDTYENDTIHTRTGRYIRERDGGSNNPRFSHHSAPPAVKYRPRTVKYRTRTVLNPRRKVRYRTVQYPRRTVLYRPRTVLYRTSPVPCRTPKVRYRIVIYSRRAVKYGTRAGKGGTGGKWLFIQKDQMGPTVLDTSVPTEVGPTLYNHNIGGNRAYF